MNNISRNLTPISQAIFTHDIEAAQRVGIDANAIDSETMNFLNQYKSKLFSTLYSAADNVTDRASFVSVASEKMLFEVHVLTRLLDMNNQLHTVCADFAKSTDPDMQNVPAAELAKVGALLIGSRLIDSIADQAYGPEA